MSNKCQHEQTCSPSGNTNMNNPDINLQAWHLQSQKRSSVMFDCNTFMHNDPKILRKENFALCSIWCKTWHAGLKSELLRRARQCASVEANLIGCINELHTLVGDGEDDGRDFSHLFCRPLELKRIQTLRWFTVHVYYKHTQASPFWRLEKKLVTYPHFGTGILRGLGTP